MVKKKNVKWRMCVYFIDLNKACLKDSFPLPHINQLIDTTARHELLSFLDAYSGYNQILMEEGDQEKTTSITHRGTYCYRIMPFGLKNAGATYQRQVTKMFKNQLGKTIEVYNDEMLVKSLRAEDHIDHLKETFKILRKHGMKLNPEKCAFDVTSEKVLGFLRLTGRIAALSKFISRSSDMCHRFFNILKKDNGIEWTPECVQVLKELKAYMSSPPLLSKPEIEEFLLVYLIVSEVTCQMMLEAEKEANQASHLTRDLWVLHTDVASNACGSGLRLMLEVPTGEVILQSIRCPNITNNEADYKAYYEAVIAGLGLALENGARHLQLRCDSQLVVNQLDQIPRTQNVEADGLAKLAAATKSITPGDRSVDETLPNDKKKARKLRMQVARYNFFHRDLYKRTYNIPLAKSLGPNQTQRVFEEVHEGHCDSHSGDRELVRKTPKMSTRETPYSLVYRMEAVISVEVGQPSLRYSSESDTDNDENMRQDLDEVEERRDMTYIRMVAQKNNKQNATTTKIPVTQDDGLHA
nr:uncharacterized protein LOC104116171 [Nicotiana tomentosiformis]